MKDNKTSHLKLPGLSKKEWVRYLTDKEVAKIIKSYKRSKQK